MPKQNRQRQQPRSQIIRNKLSLYKEDLANNRAINIPLIVPPYDFLNDRWDISMTKVYQKLKEYMDMKNRIGSLMIGYYLGELIDLSATPKESWKKYLENNPIKNYRYVHRGSTQIYSLFKNHKDQIYRTNHLTFWSLAEMSNTDFLNDLIHYAPTLPTTIIFDNTLTTNDILDPSEFLAQEDLSL